METKAKIILVIFLIILFGVIFWFVTAYRNYTSCQNNENPFCPTYSCGQDPTATHIQCRGDQYDEAFVPFRTDKDGNIDCQPTLLEPVIYRN